MASGYPATVEDLITELCRLPGIGTKTAERLAYHILMAPTDEALRLSDAVRAVKEKVSACHVCYNVADGERCAICSDLRRDASLVCVVEQPKDLLSLEKTGTFRGRYHVLQGRISPLDGIEPDDLTIGALIERVRQGEIREVIMATNPTLEGDGTALYLSNLLASYSVRVTRLARGLASGSGLEFANKAMLTDALAGRREF